MQLYCINRRKIKVSRSHLTLEKNINKPEEDLGGVCCCEANGEPLSCLPSLLKPCQLCHMHHTITLISWEYWYNTLEINHGPSITKPIPRVAYRIKHYGKGNENLREPNLTNTWAKSSDSTKCCASGGSLPLPAGLMRGLGQGTRGRDYDHVQYPSSAR